MDRRCVTGMSQKRDISRFVTKLPKVGKSAYLGGEAARSIFRSAGKCVESSDAPSLASLAETFTGME
jgi:hypothetical protein